MVAWTTGSHAPAPGQRSRSLRWVALALALAASALAFEAAANPPAELEAEPIARSR